MSKFIEITTESGLTAMINVDNIIRVDKTDDDKAFIQTHAVKKIGYGITTKESYYDVRAMILYK